MARRPADVTCHGILRSHTRTVRQLLLLHWRNLDSPCDSSAAMQELVFNEERCENEKCLADYGINMDFIKQVGSRSAM